ncbi:MAG: xanthine dehydrogenase family protein subunit M [Acidobacteria bacterium]|nr:xanthine dehydrogenase family protein subunit M [Acidobacteriota bacterium]
MSLPPFEYLAPTTTADLAGLLATHRDKCRVLAGGTDLVNWMAEKIYRPDYVIDLRKLPLSGIRYEPGRGLTIGAATTIEAIERSPEIRRFYLALAQAAGQIGSPQIRAMATIGGNCCNASPCADMPPPLVTLEARVVLTSTRGSRELAIEEFITGNRQTAIQPDEFLECVRVPDPWPHSACRYSPFGLRAAQEIDIASVAVNVAVDPATGAVSKARIAMGAVAPFAMRAPQAEAQLVGKKPTSDVIDEIAIQCGRECRPIDDLRASASYRRHIVGVLARRMLRDAVAAIA